MTKLIASRAYNKRETEKSDWSGRIGQTEFAIEAASEITVTLDGKTLPASSVEYLMTFALQSMQDAYAGADSLSAAIGAFEKKRDAIIAGTLGVRGSGAGVSTFVTVARSIVRALFKAKHGKAFDGTDKTLDEMFEKNREALTPRVDAEIERRAAAARDKKEIMAGVELDL